MRPLLNDVMLRIREIKLPLDHSEDALKEAIVRQLHLDDSQLLSYTIARRGYDARRRGDVVFVYTIDVEIRNERQVLRQCRNRAQVGLAPDLVYRFVAQAPTPLRTRPVIIGLGPAGLFAGLILAQMGFCPLIVERGKAVRERTQDTFGLWRHRQLNPESNVQFGEGGAGTFSDGKLHSQIKDPGHYGRKVLTEFVNAGAAPEILYMSKPHIGTFRLVGILEKMRAAIQSLGGEIRFESHVIDVDIDQHHVRGVRLANDHYIPTHTVVLAIGHSARDTFAMLYNRGVFIEPKPFSIGFRIEHPQSLIDHARFGRQAGHRSLGAADYKLAYHAQNGRSVYSFCMCPGGTVVAAASEPGGVVTNGMSQYSRNERNANSGIVVGVTPTDYPGHPLAGVAFQRRLEAQAFVLGGQDYCAPGQLLGDFLTQRPSTTWGSVSPSYQPGVRLGDLSHALPSYAVDAIRAALPHFGHVIAGFTMPDAVLTGVETRTSSPIRIRRGEDYQSVTTKGLYPTGEGAGYAGGILSAAVDGIKVAEAVAMSITKR